MSDTNAGMVPVVLAVLTRLGAVAGTARGMITHTRGVSW
jgi:hypothetical protein